jgi:hypothetical protein
MMDRWRSGLLAAAALTLVAAGGPADGPAPALELRAHLFNSRTGALSPDVLPLEGGIGNAPAGEYASTSTLVVVRLVPSDGRPVAPRSQVRLTATIAGKLVLDRTARTGATDAEGATHVGFWLPATGCQPIQLQASLVGRANAAGSALLPFACYE